MNKNTCIMLGFIVGLIIGLIAVVGHSINSESAIAIKQCEQELPRNQYCVIKAVPEKESEK